MILMPTAEEMKSEFTTARNNLAALRFFYEYLQKNDRR